MSEQFDKVSFTPKPDLQTADYSEAVLKREPPTAAQVVYRDVMHEVLRNEQHGMVHGEGNALSVPDAFAKGLRKAFNNPSGPAMAAALGIKLS